MDLDVMVRKSLRLIALALSIGLVIAGFLLGDYVLVRFLVRFVCTSCVGLG